MGHNRTKYDQVEKENSNNTRKGSNSHRMASLEARSRDQSRNHSLVERKRTSRSGSHKGLPGSTKARKTQMVQAIHKKQALAAKGEKAVHDPASEFSAVHDPAVPSGKEKKNARTNACPCLACCTRFASW